MNQFLYFKGNYCIPSQLLCCSCILKGTTVYLHSYYAVLVQYVKGNYCIVYTFTATMLFLYFKGNYCIHSQLLCCSCILNGTTVLYTFTATMLFLYFKGNYSILDLHSYYAVLVCSSEGNTKLATAQFFMQLHYNYKQLKEQGHRNEEICVSYPFI